METHLQPVCPFALAVLVPGTAWAGCLVQLPPCLDADLQPEVSPDAELAERGWWKVSSCLGCGWEAVIRLQRRDDGDCSEHCLHRDKHRQQQPLIELMPSSSTMLHAECAGALLESSVTRHVLRPGMPESNLCVRPMGSSPAQSIAAGSTSGPLLAGHSGQSCKLWPHQWPGRRACQAQ